MEIIIFIILLYVAYKVNSIFSKSTKENSHSEEIQPDSEGSEYYKFEFGLIPPGYFYHEMVGMYYRGITTKDFGVFYGRAVAQTNNPEDKYAIGIYRNSDNKLVGYIPRAEGEAKEELHKILLYYGGSTEAIFRIQGYSTRCYGAVYIKEGRKLFREGNERNPYTVRKTDKFNFYPTSWNSGIHKCYIGINRPQKEFDYTVSAFNEAGEIIGKTDHDQLRLFDYVEEKGNGILCWCHIDFQSGKATLYVPLNFTKEESEQKLNKFLEKNAPVLVEPDE